MATIQDDKTRVENPQSALKSVKNWGKSPSDLSFLKLSARELKKIKIVDNTATPNTHYNYYILEQCAKTRVKSRRGNKCSFLAFLSCILSPSTYPLFTYML